jgi:hypothetical protein
LQDTKPQPQAQDVPRRRRWRALSKKPRFFAQRALGRAEARIQRFYEFSR